MAASNIPSRELGEEYWLATNTTPAALDNFFDEDSTVSWTGSGAAKHHEKSNWNKPLANTAITGKENNELQYRTSSILDNITVTDDSQSQTPTTKSAEGLVLGVGRSLGSLGERLNEWKPPAVRKWVVGSNSVLERCSNCVRLEREVTQLTSRVQSAAPAHHVPLPISTAVRLLLLGERPSLQGYTSLAAKRELLDEAVRLADTDVVVAVLLHCRNTLNKHLFMQELRCRPLAVQSFVCYLRQRRQVTEAVEVLQSLGRGEEAALLLYRQCLTVDASRRASRLRQLADQQLATPQLTSYKRQILQQADLLEQQLALDLRDSSQQHKNAVLTEYPRASSLAGAPLLTTLYYCSMYHWAEGTASDPGLIRTAYGLTDRQYLWGVVRGRARVRHYYLPHQLAGLLQQRSGVLGALSGALEAVSGGVGGALRSSLPLDTLVRVLAAAGAPDAVLTGYLSLLEPREQRLRLALQLGVQAAVVEAYVSLKDRAGLQNYLSSHLTPGSAEYVKAEAALKSGRWK